MMQSMGSHDILLHFLANQFIPVYPVVMAVLFPKALLTIST